MTRETKEHCLSIFFVTLVLVAGILFLKINQKAPLHPVQGQNSFSDIPLGDFNSAFAQALLLESLEYFYPEHSEQNAEIANSIIRQKEAQFQEIIQKGHLKQSLSFKKGVGILTMALKFIFIYVLVLGLRRE